RARATPGKSPSEASILRMHPPQLMPGTDKSVCRKSVSMTRLASSSSSVESRVDTDAAATVSPHRAIGVPGGMAQPWEYDDQPDEPRGDRQQKQGEHQETPDEHGRQIVPDQRPT